MQQEFKSLLSIFSVKERGLMVRDTIVVTGKGGTGSVLVSDMIDDFPFSNGSSKS